MYHKQQHTGFTLVETLVAIAILLITIVGPMTIASRGLQGAYFARDQVVATYLAQESMERVFQIRDNAALNEFGTNGSASNYWGWVNDLTTGGQDCDHSFGCDWNYTLGRFDKCDSGHNNCVLIKGTDVYGADQSGATSIFTREVHIDEFRPDEEVLVRVRVSWDAPGIPGTQQVVIQSSITNQYAGI